MIPSRELLDRLALEFSFYRGRIGEFRVDPNDCRIDLCEGNLRIWPRLAASDSPDLIHAHFLAQLGSDDSRNLDGCILFRSEDQDSLSYAVRRYVAEVGGSLLSVLLQQDVFLSKRFSSGPSESQYTGIDSADGFTGPIHCHLQGESSDQNLIKQTNLFAGVSGLIPPLPLQLAKVTLRRNATEWDRTIELNGHSVCLQDPGFPIQFDAIEGSELTQFAVFHFAEKPDWITERKSIDESIRGFVRAFAENRDIDKSLATIRQQGADGDRVHQVHAFASLAFARRFFGEFGARYSRKYLAIRGNGTIEEKELLAEPVFGRSLVLSDEFQEGPLFESFKMLALLNTEFNELNDRMNRGERPEAIELPPPVVPDPDVSAEILEKVSRRVLKKRTGKDKCE